MGPALRIYNALIVGGHERKNRESLYPKLAQWGIRPVKHWPPTVAMTARKVPDKIDLIVVLKDYMSHSGEEHVKSINKSHIHIIRLPFSSSTWANIFKRSKLDVLRRETRPMPAARPARATPAKSASPALSPLRVAPPALPPPPAPVVPPPEAPTPVEAAVAKVAKAQRRIRHNRLVADMIGPQRYKFIEVLWDAADAGPWSSATFRQRFKRIGIKTGLLPDYIGDNAIEALFKNPAALAIANNTLLIEQINIRLTKVERRVTPPQVVRPEVKPEPVQVIEQPKQKPSRVVVEASMMRIINDLEGVRTIIDELIEHAKSTIADAKKLISED